MEEALVTILIVCTVIFFVARGILLWYWRINELLDTLHQMDKRLEQMNKKLAKIQTSAANIPETTATNSTAAAEPAPINGSDIPEM